MKKGNFEPDFNFTMNGLRFRILSLYVEDPLSAVGGKKMLSCSKWIWKKFQFNKRFTDLKKRMLHVLNSSNFKMQNVWTRAKKAAD